MPKTMYHTLLTLLLALGFNTTSFSQWRSPILEKFGPDEGLTGAVRDIVQGKNGFIYIVSENGFFQYNGRNFKLYQHNPDDSTSLSSGHLHKAFVASDGLVWLAVYKSGINSFNPKTGKFTRYPLPELSFTTHTGAITVTEDHTGTIWVGAHHGRLLRLNKLSGKFDTFIFPELENLTAKGKRLDLVSLIPSVADPETLWISINGRAAPDLPYPSPGLLAFNIVNHQFTWHPCNMVLRYQDTKGILWGTTWGSNIIRYDPVSKNCQLHTFQEFYGDYPAPFGGPVSFDYIGYNHKLLIANLGVLEFKPEGKVDYFIPPLNDKEYISLFTDRSDNLWVGHPDGAVVMAPKHQNIRFFSLSKHNVKGRLYPGRISYHESSDQVFLAFYHKEQPNRLYSIPLNDNAETRDRFTEFPEPVLGTAVGKSGQVYVNSGGRIYQSRHDPFSPVLINFPSSDLKEIPWTWYMASTPSGWICGLGDSAFFWFHEELKSLSSVNMNTSSTALSEDRFEGFSFLSGERALLHSSFNLHIVDLASGAFEDVKLTGAAAREIDYITSAKEDREGNVWVSTNSTIFKTALSGDTLLLVDKFTTFDGIISPTIKEIHFDQHNRIWIYSNSGMDAMDPRTREVRHFGLREGLPVLFVDPVQPLLLPDGRMVNVCENGLVVFNADSLWHAFDPESGPLIIQDVRINGKLYHQDTLPDFSGQVYLPAGNSVVDLTFNALTYPTNDKVSYSYRLNGDQGQWIDIGKNSFLTLPDLPFGKTLLEIKAGPPGYELQPKSLLFFKPTPFYARGWFIPLMVMLGILAISSIAFFRVRQIEAKAVEEMAVNKRLSELELKALRSQMNPHFMFNSLNSIKTYILEAKPDVAADYLSQFAHLIRKILQNSREKKITLREEIDTLLLYISLEQFRFEDAFKFEHHVDKAIPLDDVLIPPMLLQPFVENAIWHGLMHKDSGGVLKLIFLKKGSFLQCEIDDNGVGRQKAMALNSLSARKHKSMGLGITQNRIDLLNSLESFGITIDTLDKKDSQGRAIGTKVILSMPCNEPKD